MKTFIALALLLLVSGCVSTHMKQFIGCDVRDVVISDGPPANVFDYGEDLRIFQFYWGGGTFTTPSVSQTTGSAYAIGSTVYGSATTITTPGQTFTSPGCFVSYYTRWNGNGWIVYDISYPQRLVC